MTALDDIAAQREKDFREMQQAQQQRPQPSPGGGVPGGPRPQPQQNYQQPRPQQQQQRPAMQNKPKKRSSSMGGDNFFTKYIDGAKTIFENIRDGVVDWGEVLGWGFPLCLTDILWLGCLFSFMNSLIGVGVIDSDTIEWYHYLLSGIAYIAMTKFEVKFLNPRRLLEHPILIPFYLIVIGIDVGGIYYGVIGIINQKQVDFAAWHIEVNLHDNSLWLWGLFFVSVALAYGLEHSHKTCASGVKEGFGI